MSTIIEVKESGLKEDDPQIVNKMMGEKEGLVYMLSCLKAYLENGVTNSRASLIHKLLNFKSKKARFSNHIRMLNRALYFRLCVCVLLYINFFFIF